MAVVNAGKRTPRSRVRPSKLSDFIDTSPSKKYRHHKRNSSDEFVEDAHSYDEIQEDLQKPSALFDAVDDVEGQDIFRFKSRHTKNDLKVKAKNAITFNTPKVLSALNTSPRVVVTPRNVFLKKEKNTGVTPRHINNKITEKIKQQVENDSSDSDFSASSSDFIPDEDSENESESSSAVSESDSSDDNTQSTSTKSAIKSNRVNGVKSHHADYFVTPDNYFAMNSTKKIATSDHTLSRLKNLHLDETNQKNNFISSEHRTKIMKLTDSYDQLFDKWLYALSENFNIILYGIGSKKLVLQRFQKEKLMDFPCVVVNGFFPSLTIKSILETIVIGLLENTSVPSNLGETISLIDTQLTTSGTELFLIIHNIDGAMLRTAKAQGALASLSQIKNVHTIATLDHINGPLLWDHSKLSKFRFTWWDVTTFMPYTEETSFENSVMSQNNGALQLSSLKSVYQSLTTNGKGILNIIIQYQLENSKQVQYQGLPFKELYSKAREQFLVSSDAALRAQLTEFLDHKLVKMKRIHDGSDNLMMPVDNTLLQQFLEHEI